MVVDMESQREIYLDPEVAKETYREQFGQHRDALQSICDSLGVDLYTMRTDEPLEHSLFHLISTQRRRSAGTARAGMLASAGRVGSSGAGGNPGGGTS
jgi:hypothetical protein